MKTTFHDSPLSEADFSQAQLNLLRSNNILTVAHLLALASMAEGLLALSALLDVKESELARIMSKMKADHPDASLDRVSGQYSYGYLPELEHKVRERRRRG